jgi:hypothetical protein
MKITNGKDFWAGVMFMGFGLGFMYVSRSYPMGSAVRMGPAYFPMVLGGILAVLGAAVFLRAFVSKIEAPMQVFPFRLWPLLAGLALGVIALYTQTTRESGTGWEVSHMILAGIAIVLMFAAFGPKPLWVVLSAVVLFGYLLKPIGVVPAIFVLIVISALPGFSWTRKDYTALPAYVAGGLLLSYLTLLVSPWVARAVVAAFGAIGVPLSATIALILTEMALSGAAGWVAARYKWPHVTAAQVTILSYALAVFSVAAFIHGLGLPINIWPSIWE